MGVGALNNVKQVSAMVRVDFRKITLTVEVDREIIEIPRSLDTVIAQEREEGRG